MVWIKRRWKLKIFVINGVELPDEFKKYFEYLKLKIKNNEVKIKIFVINGVVELPDEFKKYFEYLKLNFNIGMKQYLEFIIKKEIYSRNEDLNLF